MYRVFIVLILPMVVTMGCQSALLSTISENESAKNRITEKKQRLQYLEGQNSRLEEEKKRVLAELDEKETTLNGLYKRLDDLEKKNALAKSNTVSQERQKQKFEKQIKTYKYQISNMRNNTQLSMEEKRKKIKALKKEIKSYLLMGLR